MKGKENLRSKALKIAHKLQETISDWGNCQRIGWKLAKLQIGQSLDIEFVKATGELRKAKAIAVGSLSTIQKGFVRFVEYVSETQTKWRSFKLNRLVL